MKPFFPQNMKAWKKSEKIKGVLCIETGSETANHR